METETGGVRDALPLLNASACVRAHARACALALSGSYQDGKQLVELLLLAHAGSIGRVCVCVCGDGCERGCVFARSAHEPRAQVDNVANDCVLATRGRPDVSGKRLARRHPHARVQPGCAQTHAEPHHRAQLRVAGGPAARGHAHVRQPQHTDQHSA